ncbi:MAG: chemotaxis protein CheW [Myxococcales bacterium]|nr:chemotaxis protein CheW [Myxococcales bacterium]
MNTNSAAIEDVAATLACVDVDDLVAIAALADRIGSLASEESAPAVAGMLQRAARKLRAVAEDRAKNPSANLAAANKLVAASSRTRKSEPAPPSVIEPAPARSLRPAEPEAAPRPTADESGEADAELVNEFVSESQEYVAAAEQALLVLEENPDDRPALDTVFRAFHTVKGVAAVLGFSRVADFAHRAESLLSPIRDGRARFGSEYATLSLRAVDMIRSLVGRTAATLQGQAFSLPDGYLELMDALEHPERIGVGAGPSPEAPPVAGDTRAVGDAPPAGAPPAHHAASAEAWVRVRTDRLDQLMDIVGELVIAHAMVAADGRVTADQARDLARKVAHAGKTVRELQDLSLSLRMVPLRATFQKMTRVVRDTARRVERRVELVTDGEETEIDRKLVDALADPLVHMVRNAVDHGIEPPAQRLAAGKPEAGTVRLSAYHAGGNVVVELSDDGRGLDRDKLVARALEKGLIDSAEGLGDQEAFQLIFEPGFSTAAAVTDVSGRGVGMDVVRRAIESLNGRVDISSVKGKGTTFSVRIPLTLAITDGMLVKVGGERYIVPSSNIRITIRPEPACLKTVAGRGELVILRGEAIPMFRLHRIFGVDGAVEDPTRGLVVIVGENEGCSALLVDDLLGKQQVVTKSLGEFIGKVPGVSGGAILGDGRVGLILDPVGLTALARQQPNLADGPPLAA